MIVLINLSHNCGHIVVIKTNNEKDTIVKIKEKLAKV
jgi:hypothetical protein